ncbi:MAG: DNA polymerase III subunit delta [Dehalococcoidia bacterium]
MIHVLYGKDSFSLREKLDALRASLDPDGALATNTIVLDGRKTSAAEVMGACDTVPFLGSHRLVIVEGLLSRVGGRRGAEASSEAAAWQPLGEYAGRIPESSHLVLIDGDVSAGNPLLAALKGEAEVQEFKPPKGRAIQEWIQRRAAARGVKLAPGAVRLLADFVGDDLWTLAGEIEKLSLYAGDATVTEDDVRALVASVRETSVFHLVDAIVEGRSAAAVRLLRNMFQQDKAAPYVLAMIERQLRLIAVAREMLDRGEGSGRIGRELGLPPWALDRLVDQAGSYSAARVRAAFERLLEADLQVKRGVYDPELALELFVYDLASRRASAVA